MKELNENGGLPSPEKVLQQNLSQEGEFQSVYMMCLLFQEKEERPAAEQVRAKLEAAFGKTDIVADVDGGMTSFALLEHMVQYKDGAAPAELLLTDFSPFDPDKIDDIARTQFWDCPEGEDILSRCRYQLMISDFLAAGLPYPERCAILAKWAEVASGLFSGCEAVWFAPSGKLLTPRQLRENPWGDEEKFLYGGMNIRFFNVQGTEDMIVDTLGLYAVGLPDLQYHFTGLDPNEVVHHASSVASYIYAKDAPIQSGETIDGLEDGEISMDVRWRCQYENALIQPVREVMDIEAGDYAAGRRE